MTARKVAGSFGMLFAVSSLIAGCGLFSGSDDDDGCDSMRTGTVVTQDLGSGRLARIAAKPKPSPAKKAKPAKKLGTGHGTANHHKHHDSDLFDDDDDC